MEHRLKIAKEELGADYTVLVGKNDTDETVTKKIIDALGSEPSISLECSGAEICAKVAVQVSYVFLQIGFYYSFKGTKSRKTVRTSLVCFPQFLAVVGSIKINIVTQ